MPKTINTASTQALLAVVALLATPLLSGCSRCSDEPRVPFKLNPTPEGTEVKAALEGADAGLFSVQVFDAPVDEPTLAGSKLTLAHVRATLELDLDGDGDRDVLAVTEEDGQRVRLLYATRDPQGFAVPQPVNGFSEQTHLGCSLPVARFMPLSASKAALALGVSCPDPTAQLAPYSSLTLLSLESTPRVYERLDVIGNDGSGVPLLTLTPHSLDADGDGHDDVALTVTLPGPAVATDALELVWLDRPSGLVRDPREPEATLSAWAAAAQSLVAKSPDQAIARAELALRLSRAVCRESGSAAIALAGAPGVPCGPLKSTGSLLATLVSAYARRGNIGAAFDSDRALRRADPKPSDRTLEQAHAALQKLPAEPGISLRRGPQVLPVRSPRVHLPSARFIGESTLYVHRVSSVLVDLASGNESAAPSTDQLVRDPTGRLIATAIERTCDGHAVRIEHAPPPGSDYTVQSAIASAVIAQAPIPPGCTRSSTRPDDGGFSLLGWAPQGLVAVRGSEVRVVPLAADGQAAGPARILAPEAPRPAPLPSGSATADGARYVEPTPYGVLVYGPNSHRVELWRPEGYTSIATGTLEASISPSARRVALVAGTDVYFLERN